MNGIGFLLVVLCTREDTIYTNTCLKMNMWLILCRVLCFQREAFSYTPNICLNTYQSVSCPVLLPHKGSLLCPPAIRMVNNNILLGLNSLASLPLKITCLFRVYKVSEVFIFSVYTSNPRYLQCTLFKSYNKITYV